MACLPTNRFEPLADVIRISPSFTDEILTALSFTNTSSSFSIKESSLIFDERNTLIPESVTSLGLYVKPRLIFANSANLRCSQSSVKPGNLIFGTAIVTASPQFRAPRRTYSASRLSLIFPSLPSAAPCRHRSGLSPLPPRKYPHSARCSG